MIQDPNFEEENIFKAAGILKIFFSFFIVKNYSESAGNLSKWIRAVLKVQNALLIVVKIIIKK